MSRRGVYDIIHAWADLIGGFKKEQSPTVLSASEERVDERRVLVEEIMEERDEDGAYFAYSAMDVRRKLRATAPEYLCGIRTIQRDINNCGLVWRVRPLTQAMTAEHKRKRVAAVEDLLSVDHHSIIFSDESYFDCSDHHKSMWVRHGEEPTPRPKERYSSKVMVWGLIGYNFRLLVILNGSSVDGAEYKDTLKRFLLPRIDVETQTFMQDGAPAHRSKLVRDFLAESEVRVLAWPWKRRIDVSIFDDQQSLEREIRRVWSEIHQDEINSLIDSFPHRVEVLRTNGGENVQLRRVQ